MLEKFIFTDHALIAFRYPNAFNQTTVQASVTTPLSKERRLIRRDRVLCGPGPCKTLAKNCNYLAHAMISNKKAVLTHVDGHVQVST